MAYKYPEGMIPKQPFYEKESEDINRFSSDYHKLLSGVLEQLLKANNQLTKHYPHHEVFYADRHYVKQHQAIYFQIIMSYKAFRGSIERILDFSSKILDHIDLTIPDLEMKFASPIPVYALDRYLQLQANNSHHVFPDNQKQ